MSNIIMMLMLLTSLFFMFINHPISFSMILLIQTLLTSFITGLISFHFWFSYILFIIMVGGLLILFMYMTSVASNEKFKFSPKISILIFIMLMTSMIILFIDPTLLNIMNNFNLKFKSSMNLSLSKYINKPNNLLLFMMIIYLLISLIMVVKITKVSYGPLRQKN